jgi:cation transport ATPase
VVDGYALVEQTSVRGGLGSARVAFGDEVLAGSSLLAGQIEIEVLKTGPQTQAAQIAHSLIDGARGLAFDPFLRRQADALADRPVPATLAIAGVGYLVGGLFTVGAVLHQDHASGPNMAVPLQTLRDMNLALRQGVVVRRGGALPRLAESRFVVLDDHPAWSEPQLELEAVHSRLAEPETDKLLRYAAGAGLYLGDERATALADACLVRGLVVRQPPLLSLDAEKLTVRQGEHVLSLREVPGTGKRTLRVEIDGEEVALLDFRQGYALRATRAVQRLRQQGKQVFLLSSRPEQETEELARLLGADLHGGDFAPEGKLRFLEGLSRRGVLATYVGQGELDPALAGAAYVNVSLGGAEGLANEAADLVVLGNSLDALASVDELAQSHQASVQAVCRRALAPNILCIIGGYVGVLNGITSGVIANIGVNNVYKQVKKSLRESPASLRRTSV